MFLWKWRSRLLCFENGLNIIAELPIIHHHSGGVRPPDRLPPDDDDEEDDVVVVLRSRIQKLQLVNDSIGNSDLEVFDRLIISLELVLSAHVC